MKSAYFAAALALSIVSTVQAASLISLPSQRNELSLDGPWTLSTAGGIAQPVTVPLNIDFTYGPSTWTRNFALALPAAPQVALLKFGGVVNTGTVTLNGTAIGTLVAFTPASFDVSAALNPNGVNTLVVVLEDRLSNTTVPGGNTASLLASQGNMAYTLPVAWPNRPGIVRSVSLVYSDSPVMTDVSVQQVFNPALTSLDLLVRVKIAGTVGPLTAAFVALGLAGTVEDSCLAFAPQPGADLSCRMHVDFPSLWSPDTPTLHDMSVALYDNGALVDAGRDRLGFRKFEARQCRFYLNNQPIFLRGVSRHDLYGSSGFVPDTATISQDIVRMKYLGLNYIRSIHYPPDEQLARQADELGMLVSEEIPAWADFARPEVADIASQMLQTLIARDFNRASVIAYYVASVNTERPQGYLARAIPTVGQADPSRLVSFLYDDSLTAPEDVAAKAQFARDAGASFYAQNTYWNGAVYSAAAAGFPSDYPMMATEWTGAEGSDRGPIGMPGSISFPGFSDSTDGNYPESYEATKLTEGFNALFPYLCSDSHLTGCLAGIVYYNWQDLDWPGMPYFYPNHFPAIRNGLVFEDRVFKTSPSSLFGYLMPYLPR